MVPPPSTPPPPDASIQKDTWESGIAMIVTTQIIPTSPLQYFVTT